MNKKITHIQVAGKGKNLTLFPFYEITPTENEKEERKTITKPIPNGLSLDLRLGLDLLAYKTTCPAHVAKSLNF